MNWIHLVKKTWFWKCNTSFPHEVQFDLRFLANSSKQWALGGNKDSRHSSIGGFRECLLGTLHTTKGSFSPIIWLFWPTNSPIMNGSYGCRWIESKGTTGSPWLVTWNFCAGTNNSYLQPIVGCDILYIPKRKKLIFDKLQVLFLVSDPDHNQTSVMWGKLVDWNLL